MNFPTAYSEIIDRVNNFDALPYARTRNFRDGGVSYLSPYISRGVISTKFVLEKLKEKDYPFAKIEKFIQELAWRDYWQLVWSNKGELINQDLKQAQKEVDHYEIPVNIDQANTGITAIDSAIQDLKQRGYMHNHMRMYVAALCCNNGKSHWEQPAKWMFYHLLDGDWASNALSWQWVAGSNSNKKYIANQENINKYFNDTQKQSFLDKSYPDLAQMTCPDELKETFIPPLEIILPVQTELLINPARPVLLYNEYNLDPLWRHDLDANRILLLDPKRLESYPMGPKTIDFILKLGENIPALQVFIGNFSEFQLRYSPKKVFFKEHPLNTDYVGVQTSRDWLSSVRGDYSSFFAFWKKCKREIIY